MRVLIADKVPESAHLQLRAGGCEVIYQPELSGEALAEALGRTRAEALVVRSTKVGAAALEAGIGLGLVVRAGAGVNTIDVGTAAARGIYVANCPGKNAEAVAELAWGLILGADRQIPNATADLRAGLWRKKAYSQARGLHGRTLGLIGMGSIGQAMVPRGRAFGMRVVAWSRSLSAEAAAALGVEAMPSPLEVAARADVVSVHVALTEATRGFIGASIFEAMRTGAIFINTSRGEVVDEAALLRGLRERGLRAGLDVFCGEPGDGDGCLESPLLAEPMCIGTHHIGASTAQAQEAVAAEAARIILAFKERGVVPNCVNLAGRSAASHVLVVRHLDEVGVLAGVLEALRAAQINVQEMENTIFDGGLAAVARIRLEGAPPTEVIGAIEQTPHVLGTSLLTLDPEAPSVEL